MLRQSAFALSRIVSCSAGSARMYLSHMIAQKVPISCVARAI